MLEQLPHSKTQPTGGGAVIMSYECRLAEGVRAPEGRRLLRQRLLHRRRRRHLGLLGLTSAYLCAARPTRALLHPHCTTPHCTPHSIFLSVYPPSRPSSDRMAERIAWGLGFYRGHTGPRGKPGWISHGPNASAIEVEVDNVLPDIDPYSGTQLAPRRPTVLQLRASDAIA